MSMTVEIVPQSPALPPPESPIPGMCIENTENNNERKISTESRQSMTMLATTSSQNELVPDDADIDEVNRSLMQSMLLTPLFTCKRENYHYQIVIMIKKATILVKHNF